MSRGTFSEDEDVKGAQFHRRENYKKAANNLFSDEKLPQFLMTKKDKDNRRNERALSLDQIKENLPKNKNLSLDNYVEQREILMWFFVRKKEVPLIASDLDYFENQSFLERILFNEGCESEAVDENLSFLYGQCLVLSLFSLGNQSSNEADDKKYEDFLQPKIAELKKYKSSKKDSKDRDKDNYFKKNIDFKNMFSDVNINLSPAKHRIYNYLRTPRSEEEKKSLEIYSQIQLIQKKLDNAEASDEMALAQEKEKLFNQIKNNKKVILLMQVDNILQQKWNALHGLLKLKNDLIEKSVSQIESKDPTYDKHQLTLETRYKTISIFSADNDDPYKNLAGSIGFIFKYPLPYWVSANKLKDWILNDPVFFSLTLKNNEIARQYIVDKLLSEKGTLKELITELESAKSILETNKDNIPQINYIIDLVNELKKFRDLESKADTISPVKKPKPPASPRPPKTTATVTELSVSEISELESEELKLHSDTEEISEAKTRTISSSQSTVTSKQPLAPRTNPQNITRNIYKLDEKFSESNHSIIRIIKSTQEPIELKEYHGLKIGEIAINTNTRTNTQFREERLANGSYVITAVEIPTTDRFHLFQGFSVPDEKLVQYVYPQIQKLQQLGKLDKDFTFDISGTNENLKQTYALFCEINNLKYTYDNKPYKPLPGQLEAFRNYLNELKKAQVEQSRPRLSVWNRIKNRFFSRPTYPVLNTDKKEEKKSESVSRSKEIESPVSASEDFITSLFAKLKTDLSSGFAKIEKKKNPSVTLFEDITSRILDYSTDVDASIRSLQEKAKRTKQQEVKLERLRKLAKFIESVNTIIREKNKSSSTNKNVSLLKEFNSLCEEYQKEDENILKLGVISEPVNDDTIREREEVTSSTATSPSSVNQKEAQPSPRVELDSPPKKEVKESQSSKVTTKKFGIFSTHQPDAMTLWVKKMNQGLRELEQRTNKDILAMENVIYTPGEYIDLSLKTNLGKDYASLIRHKEILQNRNAAGNLNTSDKNNLRRLEAIIKRIDVLIEREKYLELGSISYIQSAADQFSKKLSDKDLLAPSPDKKRAR